MSNLDSIFKSRDISLLTKVHLAKAMVFPVVMYGCESWTVKKAEHQKIDGVELWCWRRLLRVPWTARRSNQSIVKEISPGCSLEGLMLKLKLQYSWCEELTHWKRPWCWERLKAGGEGGDRGWDGWMASLTRWTWVWVDSGSWWWTGRPGVLQSVGSQSVGHDWPSGRQHIRCGKIFPAYSSSNRVSSLLLSTGLHTFSYKVQEQKPVDYTKRSAVREALHP